jgi:hypothetical protein
MPEMRVPGGQQVDVDPVKPLPGGGARVDVVDERGRKWRLDVPKTGDGVEIVTTWRDGELADLELPEWIDDVLVQLQRA